jgi:predicted DCC family thiol-disulfide oxidoreductase YuxK
VLAAGQAVRGSRRARKTVAPRLPTLLYDGHCRFCTAQMRNLARFLPEDRYEALSFQEPGVLERFPGITHEQAMEAMHLIDERGRIFSGMEAASRAVAIRPIGRLAFGYYLPGLRWVLDWGYRAIARNRYRLMGTECKDGTCALHFEPRRPS